MEQRAITNVLLGVISTLLFALLLTQNCRGSGSSHSASPTPIPNPASSEGSKINITKNQSFRNKDNGLNELDLRQPRIHILSDISGRLYLPEDLNPAPRDVKMISRIVGSLLTSKKSYGVDPDAILSSDSALDLSIQDGCLFLSNRAKMFPEIVFSKLNSSQGRRYSIKPPSRMIDKFKYRSDSSHVKGSLRYDLRRLVDGVNAAYDNFDSKGVNTLATLEAYLSKVPVDTAKYRDIYIVFTDGYVNNSMERIWSPKQVRNIVLSDGTIQDLVRHSSVTGLKGKLIILESGGRDFDPVRGLGSSLSENEVLKSLWTKWSESTGLDFKWYAKWDPMLEGEELINMIYEN